MSSEEDFWRAELASPFWRSSIFLTLLERWVREGKIAREKTTEVNMLEIQTFIVEKSTPQDKQDLYDAHDRWLERSGH